MDASSCYALPTAVSELRESRFNNSRTAPYIDSILLDKEGTDVKYVRVVDSVQNSFILDLTSADRFALTSADGRTITIDSKGVHFANSDCTVKSSVLVDGLFQQMNKLANSTCGGGGRPLNQTVPSAGGGVTAVMERRLFSMQNFFVILHMRDQCGEVLREGFMLDVRVGSSRCATYPGFPGTFVASCGLPTESSAQMRCEASVQLAIDYLTRGSPRGLCPNLAAMWTLLLNELENVVTKRALFQPFMDPALGVRPWDMVTLSQTLDSFLAFWRRATTHFASNTVGSTAMQDLVSGADIARDMKRRPCRQLHNVSSAQNLTVTSRMRTGDDIYPPSPPQVLDAFRTTPNMSQEYSLVVTDPEQKACCQKPGTCIRDERGVYYGRENRVPGSDCICGTTLGGDDQAPSGVAFRSKLCREYPACNTTNPCAEGGVCLFDSCCGFNICVNGTECHSAPATDGERGRRSIHLWSGGDGEADSMMSGGDPV